MNILRKRRNRTPEPANQAVDQPTLSSPESEHHQNSDLRSQNARQIELALLGKEIVLHLSGEEGNDNVTIKVIKIEEFAHQKNGRFSPKLRVHYQITQSLDTSEVGVTRYWFMPCHNNLDYASQQECTNTGMEQAMYHYDVLHLQDFMGQEITSAIITGRRNKKINEARFNN